MVDQQVEENKMKNSLNFDDNLERDIKKKVSDMTLNYQTQLNLKKDLKLKRIQVSKSLIQSQIRSARESLEQAQKLRKEAKE
jgi:Tfp pilus assembly pilus retraction ATPase PilT